MLCKNCQKEIGNDRDCKFCGYDPLLDDPRNAERGLSVFDDVVVPPLQTVILKKPNKNAKNGLILSLFNWCPVPFLPLSLIYCIVGFFSAKKYRTGRVTAIIGLIICILSIAVWYYLSVKFIIPEISSEL